MNVSVCVRERERERKSAFEYLLVYFHACGHSVCQCIRMYVCTCTRLTNSCRGKLSFRV